MAIITQQMSDIDSSVLKELDDGATGLILDNLQKYQYSFPFKSSVREMFSNAVDAISEREVALAILRGDIKEEDVFVTTEETQLYKDSDFQREYYNPDWMSSNPNVYIRYFVRPAGQRDLLVIEDEGVGLSPIGYQGKASRMEGYFRLGYSTKRKNKFTLGRYGIGAKAALSTGVDFFTVRNFYNGEEFAANVMAMDYQNIMPDKRPNPQTGMIERGKPYIIGRKNPRTFYAYPTGRLNGLIMEMEVKKHNYAKVVEAVKSQLMYFPQAVFEIIQADGTSYIMDIKANILRKTDEFIVTDQNYYQQPHIVLSGVNYGLINWEEMEMDKKNGALGVIVKQEDLDITPSRESIVWSEKTRNTVNAAMARVVEVATEVINLEVDTDDLATWVNNVGAITQFRGALNNTNLKVLTVLRHMIDMDGINPRFKLNGVEYTLREVQSAIYIRKLSPNYEKIDRTRTMEINLDSLYHMGPGVGTSVGKDRTIMGRHPDGAYTIQSVFNEDGTFRNEECREYAIKNCRPFMFRSMDWEVLVNYVNDYFAQRTKPYADIEVEKEIAQKAEKQEKEETEKKTEELNRTKTREELLATGQYISIKNVGMSSSNMKVSTQWMASLKTSELYYGNQADRDVLEMANSIIDDGRLCHNHELTDSDDRSKADRKNRSALGGIWYYNDEMMQYIIDIGYRIPTFMVTSNSMIYPELTPYCPLVEVSIQNTRHMKGFRHINEFFERIENGTLTMATALINWNTARIMRKELQHYDLLMKSEVIRSYLPQFCLLLAECDSYIKRYGGKGSESEWMKELEKMLDRLTTLQLFVAHNPGDKEAIADMVIEMGHSGDVTNALAVDIRMVEKAKAVGEYMETISLLRWIHPHNTTHSESRPADLMARDIQEFLSSKGIVDISLTDF